MTLSQVRHEIVNKINNLLLFPEILQVESNLSPEILNTKINPNSGLTIGRAFEILKGDSKRAHELIKAIDTAVQAEQQPATGDNLNKTADQLIREGEIMSDHQDEATNTRTATVKERGTGAIYTVIRKDGECISISQGSPEKQPTETAKQAIQTVDISAREWWDKANGNSYFSARVTINFGMDSEVTFALPFQYGYGDHYRDVAYTAMQERGYIPTTHNVHAAYKVYRDMGITVRYSKQEGCKKRDVIEWGSN